MVWSYDKIAAYLDEAIPKYFEERKVLKDKIVSPDPSIAVPAIEALRYVNQDILDEAKILKSFLQKDYVSHW